MEEYRKAVAKENEERLLTDLKSIASVPLVKLTSNRKSSLQKIKLGVRHKSSKNPPVVSPTASKRPGFEDDESPEKSAKRVKADGNLCLAVKYIILFVARLRCSIQYMASA